MIGNKMQNQSMGNNFGTKKSHSTLGERMDSKSRKFGGFKSPSKGNTKLGTKPLANKSLKGSLKCD